MKPPKLRIASLAVAMALQSSPQMLIACLTTVLMTAPSAIAATADAAPAPVTAYGKVVVMPLSSLGSTTAAAAAIEQVMVGELSELLQQQIVPPDKLQEMAGDAADALSSCEEEVSCLMEVFGGLGWSSFVVSNMSGLGNGRIITMKLFNVRTGEELRRVSADATGDSAQLIHEMRRATVSLLAPDRLVGTLTVQCAQADVDIQIDGKSIGVTPLSHNAIKVPVGTRAIEAKGDGLVTFSTLVDVSFAENKVVTIVLPDNTLFVGGDTPYRSRWWTWTLGAAGLLATGAGIYFNLTQAETARKIENHARAGTLTIDRVELVDDEKRQWRNALIFYGIGGALTGGAGVLLSLDFF